MNRGTDDDQRGLLGGRHQTGQIGGRRPDPTRQDAPMKLEPDQRLDQLARGQVHDDVVGNGQAVQLIVRHYQRLNLMPALQQAADDEITFGNELAVACPEPLVTQVQIRVGPGGPRVSQSV